MSKNKKQTIKCDVESCKYNNTEDRACELDEILVSCTCDYDDCQCTDETICDSFEERDSDEETLEEEMIDKEENFENEEEEIIDDDENTEIDEYVEVEDIEEE